jgi:argininosuccinate lyase
MNDQSKLWGGRFSQTTHVLMEKFSQSVSFDYRLYRHDIAGSIAHARMLSQNGVISEAEFDDIERGLNEIRAEIERGDFQWSEAMEDVHMNIEFALTQKIGEAGKKLHTGRSRNDQVATDVRLYLREELDAICVFLTLAQTALVELAAQHADTIMPGFTHMQSAQPVTFGHHVMAWNEMFQRDYERLQDCRKRVNISPLGCAALAGTSYPVDREMTAKELEFDAVALNSLDAVSDRDFVIEFNAAGALLMMHLSRIAEELVLWSSPAFDFVDLGDQFCTGSSIMPQKKNPDVAEIIRGKSGRVTGNLMSLLMIMKGQPLTYNRDNQEDKEPLFDTIDTLQLTLQIFAAMVPTIHVKTENMLSAAAAGYSTATDLADYLVRKQIPFRDAHEIVGKAVAYAVEKGINLTAIELEQLKIFSAAIEEDVFRVLELQGSVDSRNHIGGTAPDRVREAVDNARKLLDAREPHTV